MSEALTNGLEWVRVRDWPEGTNRAALWFSGKWGIPVEAYRESMEACVRWKSGVPQWYVVLNERREIVAGAGVIENDFHDRKDLTPNLCALYVEEEYRNRGIARAVLNHIRRDLRGMGIEKLYLVTDHTAFYEKCGWTYLTTVTGNDGVPERMYEAQTSVQSGA